MAIEQVWSRILLIYNPCKTITQQEFLYYFDKIDNHGLICGDFNAHHPSWEPSRTSANPTGSSLFEALSINTQLVLLNPPDAVTRVDPATGKTSNLDLFIGTNIFSSLKFEIGPHLTSDHSVVLLSSATLPTPRLFFRPRWNLKNITNDQWAMWTEEMRKTSIPRGATASESNNNLENVVIQVSKKHFHLSSTPHHVAQETPGGTQNAKKQCQKETELEMRIDDIPPKQIKTSSTNSLEKQKTQSTKQKKQCISLT